MNSVSLLWSMVRNIGGRWSSGWRDALAAAVAAGLCWMIAHDLLGHPQPIFAAVAAIACLSPGLPSRRRQAIYVVLGVVTGICVGELLQLLPIHQLPIQIAISTSVAIIAALTFGLAPVIPIQAAVSAVLVITLGATGAGLNRLGDVVVGVGVSLLFSQILLSPDPIRLINEAASGVFEVLARSFELDSEALAERDPQKAREAMNQFMAAHASLDILAAHMTSASAIARWSLRGRFAARRVMDLTDRFERRTVHLYATAVLFGVAFDDSIRHEEEPPSCLKDRLDRVVVACKALAGGFDGNVQDPSKCDAEESVGHSWRASMEHLRTAEEILRSIQQKRT